MLKKIETINGHEYVVPIDHNHPAAASWCEVANILKSGKASDLEAAGKAAYLRHARSCKDNGWAGVFVVMMLANDDLALVRIGPRGGHKVVWKYGRVWFS